MYIKNIIRNGKGQFVRTWEKHRIKRNCLTCKKEFETIESKIKCGKGKYCCRGCFFKAPVSQETRIKRNISRKGTKPTTNQLKALSYGWGWNKGKRGYYKHTEEWKKNMSDSHKEDKNYNWNGGIQVYRKMLERRGVDLFQCSLCNKDIKHVSRIDVHHKDKNRHNNSLENLQVLCSMCHTHIHKNWEKRKWCLS